MGTNFNIEPFLHWSKSIYQLFQFILCQKPLLKFQSIDEVHVVDTSCLSTTEYGRQQQDTVEMGLAPKFTVLNNSN